jgi:hypothetical protein
MESVEGKDMLSVLCVLHADEALDEDEEKLDSDKEGGGG